MQLLTPERVRQLPATTRRKLNADCGGEWDRVVEDADGSFTVYNNSILAARAAVPRGSPPEATSTPPAGPHHTEKPVTEARHRTSVQARTPRRVRSPEAEQLQASLGSKAPQEPTGWNVVTAPKVEREDTAVWSHDPVDVDWGSVDLDTTVSAMRERLSDGLPGAMPFKYLPDVLALHGVDFEAVEASIRNPAQVQIRPETKTKGYPVLGFRRGDVFTIVGMREPTTPTVIAVYVSSRLDGDDHQARTTSGGGGARRRPGLPTTVKALLRAIRDLGVCFAVASSDTVVDVTYEGQNLGKVNVGTVVSKETVQSDYQRIVRKVDAIDRRK